MIVMDAVGELAACQMSQAIVQAVDRLDCGGRIQEGRVRQRSFCDVHQQPQSVGHVLIESSLKPQHDRGDHIVWEP